MLFGSVPLIPMNTPMMNPQAEYRALAETQKLSFACPQPHRGSAAVGWAAVDADGSSIKIEGAILAR